MAATQGAWAAAAAAAAAPLVPLLALPFRWYPPNGKASNDTRGIANKVVNRLRANRESVQIGSVQLAPTESSVVVKEKATIGKGHERKKYYR